MKRKGYLLIIITTTLLILSLPTHAGKFITGIGYLYPEKYRRDNEINPLPFGLSIIPMIAYRGERLSVLGPRVSYRLVKSLIGLSINLNVAGDRYKANTLRQRDTALHTGFTLTVPFFALQYGQDISSTHRGNLIRLSLRVPLKINDKLMLRTSLGQEFVSEKFSKYYYGVAANEVGTFNFYDPGKEQNIFINLNATYKLNEKNSLNLNWTHTRFGKEIANSPTIRLKNFNTVGFFWNYVI